jgi:CTP:molybdopterin cytidylyltransferase MocA
VIAAIILAAGASERMGHPKALLTLRGRTFLETVIDGCRASGVSRCVVVLGPDRDKVLSRVDLGAATVVENPTPASGPIASIRLGLTEILNHPVEAVLVWHVDRPHVAVSTVTVLLDRFREGGAAVVVPEFGGTRGHPVVFGRAVFDELMQAPNDEGARAVVRADPSRVAVVSVRDSAVTEDVDTPEAYEELLRRTDSGDASPPR